MKKINFDLIFKIIVLIQLTIILIMLISSSHTNIPQTIIEPNEIGRYKEIKVKTYSGFGNRGEREDIKILDTKTGEFVNPN
jgi:hypothetical protein